MNGLKRLFRWDEALKSNPLYDSGTMKVILFAGALIVFSMVLVGALVYSFTEREIIQKLKTKDLLHIAQSMAARIDGRIERAKESSLALAHDPVILDWVASAEKKLTLKESAIGKINSLVSELGYHNSFIVSNVTSHYWDENGKLLDVISKDDPDDSWFYTFLASKKQVVVDVDYNEERGDTFVFVNALLGSMERPLGVTGVGLSLADLSKDFQSYKYGKQSDLWVVDATGVILLADDVKQNGHNLKEFVPQQATETILGQFSGESLVFDYKHDNGIRYDMISYPISSAPLRLVFSIPRSETVSLLYTIQLNTAIAVFVAIISIVFFFFYVSRRMADPYRRTLQLNEQLERQIAARTKELAQRNVEILDSITYAKRIQESLLPSVEHLKDSFAEYGLIWKPRDIVGGDFYWSRKSGSGTWVAVGDCTGHGVPGAFMTMLTISALNRLAEQASHTDPGFMLEHLNRAIKHTLNQDHRDGMPDDGLDISLCYLEGDLLAYAGAHSRLYIAEASSGAVKELAGNKKGIGYRRTPVDYRYVTETVRLVSQQMIVMTTDGLIDQNGSERNLSFGRTRLKQYLAQHSGKSASTWIQGLEKQLKLYQGDEKQRDDIAVLAFRPYASEHGRRERG